VEEEVHSLVTLRRHSFTAQLHDAFFIPHISTLFELYGSRGTLQLEHWADPTLDSKLWLIRNQSSRLVDVVPDSPDRRMVTAFHQQLHNLYRTDDLSSHGTTEEPGCSSTSPIGTEIISLTTTKPLSPPPTLADAQAGIRCLTAVAAARQSLWNQHPIVLSP